MSNVNNSNTNQLLPKPFQFQNGKYDTFEGNKSRNLETHTNTHTHATLIQQRYVQLAFPVTRNY